jgi:uncharacterized membrane protein
MSIATLALLWAIDAAETDALRMVIVQNFYGVAVENADDLASEDGSLRARKPPLS